MRDSLLHGFDAIRVDCLNGDSRETGKLTPEGLPDPSVFSTPMHREGIRVGTAVATMVRHDGKHVRSAEVRFRSFWGTEKRAELMASLDEADAEARYEALTPRVANRYSLRPSGAAADYGSWPPLDALMREPPLPGLLEKRGGGLIALDRATVEGRMHGYLNPKNDFDAAYIDNPTLGTDRARYAAKLTRQRVIEVEGYVAANVQRYCLFAFDMRWAYVTGVRPLWNEPRPQLLHVLPDAVGFLVLRPQQIAEPEGFPAFWTTCLADDYVLHKHAFLVPVVENLSGAPRPNLSDTAAHYLTALNIVPDAAGSALLWHHALATLHAPAYLAENAGGLRQGWPRVPLPADADALRASAALGAQLAALLDPDVPTLGVTVGTLRPELAAIAVPSTWPGQARDWGLRGWGNRTAAGVTMPGRGHAAARPFTPEEAVAEAHAPLLGTQVLDIGMNGASFWRGVPERV